MPTRLPPLESLRVLEACVRHENMTRAALELGVTPAAVSLRIRNLEAELGTALFTRVGPRISATNEGTILAERIAAAIAELRQAVEACRATPARILITAVPTLASRWLAGALTEYQHVNPAADVVIDASVGLSRVGTFDIALRHGPGNWKDVTAHQIFGGEVTPMVSPALAAGLDKPADLARLPLMPDQQWRAWFAQFKVPISGLRFTADYPSQELAAAAVIAGAGAALLSPILFAPLLAEGKLARPFNNVVVKSDNYYVAVAENERRSAVLELRDFLIAHAHRTRREAIDKF